MYIRFITILITIFSTLEIQAQNNPIYKNGTSQITGTWNDQGTLSEVLGAGAFEGNEHYLFDYKVNNFWAGFGLNLDDWGNGTPLNFIPFTHLGIAYQGLADDQEVYMVLVDKKNNSTDPFALGKKNQSYEYQTIPIQNLKGSSNIDLSQISVIQIGIGNVETGLGTLRIDAIELIPSNPNNKAPIVKLINPSLGAQFTDDQMINFEATASDPDGSIQEVLFYRYNELLGSDLSSPYSWSASPMEEGTYEVYAIAIDNEFKATTSNKRSISVIHVPKIIPVTANINLTDSFTISPFIYGANTTDYKKSTALRLGGNRMTGYNWENNASNAGQDYFHSSDDFMPYAVGLPTADYNKVGAVLSHFHQQAIDRSVMSLITLPMAGFVSHDKNGNVSLTETAPSERWDQVIEKKPSAFSLNPNTTDGKIYVDESVNFLVQKFGNSLSTKGIKAYSLDNEPSLWTSTHPRIHPTPTRIQELIDKSIRTSDAVKQVDPDALIFGPAVFGFPALLNLLDAPDWDQFKNSYPRFTDVYLDKMNTASKSAGKRLLDVFDTHWYPDVPGMSTDTSKSQSFIRMQLPRTLWDSTYKEPTWIGQYYGGVEILRSIHKSIDTYFPNTKLAVTEYSYGGANHISGGIAQADALGIFGKEKVFFASKWYDISDYLVSAYDLYLDANGKGLKFPNKGLKVHYSDYKNGSLYAAQDELKNIHIIILNKNQDDSLDINLNLDGSIDYDRYESFGFWNGQKDLSAGPKGNMQQNKLNIKVRPLSAHHVVLYQKPVHTDQVNHQCQCFIQQNPVQNNLRLSCLNFEHKPFHIGIIDALGKTIFEQKYEQLNHSEFSIPVQTLASGTYYLSIVQDQYNQVIKFIK